jgi:hypothetical protein
MKGTELANLLQISSHATLVYDKLCVALAAIRNIDESEEKHANYTTVSNKQLIVLMSLA